MKALVFLKALGLFIWSLPGRLLRFILSNLPLAIAVVSVWHYIEVLSRFDPAPVAVALGIVVDFGTYESVMIAARYRIGDLADDAGGKDRRKHKRQVVESRRRWSVAILMTGMSVFYHLQYYLPQGSLPSWPLAIPPALLLVVLAYFGQKDGDLWRAPDIQWPVVEKAPAAPDKAPTKGDKPARPPRIDVPRGDTAAALSAVRQLLSQGWTEPEDIAASIGRSRRQVGRYLDKVAQDNGRATAKEEVPA